MKEEEENKDSRPFQSIDNWRRMNHSLPKVCFLDSLKSCRLD